MILDIEQFVDSLSKMTMNAIVLPTEIIDDIGRTLVDIVDSEQPAEDQMGGPCWKSRHSIH
jgi:hypothetical protein